MSVLTWRSCVVAMCLLASALAGRAVHAEQPALSPKERIGKSLFEDTELSSKRNQACVLCHAPEAGFSSPRSDVNAAGAVIEGSIAGRFGNSKPPSAAYAAQSPVLYHTHEEDGGVLFTGGAFWNGRASGNKLGRPVADQARSPFLDPNEMALPDGVCVVQRVCKPASPGHYPVKLTDVWGEDICKIDLPPDLDRRCADPAAKIALEKEIREKVELAFDKIALAIAAYEASEEVNPFSSKFDLVLAGKAEFNPQEAKGLELFMDKALCANCHLLDAGPAGGPPLLTDFTYDNLGVPANPENPFYANSTSNPQGRAWVEQGLKAYLETDPLYRATAASQLGKVKVPTLRNVDKRPSTDFVKAFMHNGYFKTLKGVVNFYNTRDTKPRCKAPGLGETEAMAQNCWPGPEVSENLNKDEMGDLELTEAEEDAVVAFMKTLSDGYRPPSQ